MARPLKLKLAIVGFSIIILVIIPLLESNFLAPVTIKRWSKLTWEDFQGIPRLFSSYDAGINSGIYLEYDSTAKRYVAYAGQHNVRSWVRHSEGDESYLLMHEQLHFDISELHARKLNQFISEHPGASLYAISLRLSSINLDLNNMQDAYDYETDHSQIFDMQRRWQYRIDSLLTLEAGWVTDHYSGGKIYLPVKPDSSSGVVAAVPYRNYERTNYGMWFSFTSYLSGKVNYKNSAASILKNIKDRGETLKQFSIDTTGTFHAFAISEDTTNYTTYHVWREEEPYLFVLKAKFPNDTGDTTGYSQNAHSFLNSFQTSNTNAYWLAKLETTDTPIILTEILPAGSSKPSAFCMNVAPPTKSNGFYRGPMFSDNGALVVAYESVVHPDSLRHKDILLLNESMYSNEPDGHAQLFFVPAERLPKEPFEIKFGYVLAQDSAKKCYKFYYDVLKISNKSGPGPDRYRNGLKD